MGVLVFRGSRLAIPDGGLVISPEGSSCTLHVSYDLYPQWLKVAIEQAEESRRLADIVDELWGDGNSKEGHDALEAEVRAAMTAIVATVAAIDGFFASVIDRAPSIKLGSRHGRSSRPSRIAEAFRQAFEIGPLTFSGIKAHLEMIFDFRDQAVHPRALVREPAFHPRLKVSADRQIVMFRADNAIRATGSALHIIGPLLKIPKAKHGILAEHCPVALECVDSLLRDWGERHPGWEGLGAIAAGETHPE